jgi:hypothetical protein
MLHKLIHYAYKDVLTKHFLEKSALTPELYSSVLEVCFKKKIMYEKI